MLRAGVLKSAPVRVFVTVTDVLLLGVMCTAAYFFLRPLMFSSGADSTVERKAFFESMTFETVEKGNGVLGITAGVENPVPLTVLFLVLTVVWAVAAQVWPLLVFVGVLLGVAPELLATR